MPNPKLTKPHGITLQKTSFFMVTAVRTMPHTVVMTKLPFTNNNDDVITIMMMMTVTITTLIMNQEYK
jgi:hypothetical protein